MSRIFIQDETNSFEDRKEVWLNTPQCLYLHQQSFIHLDDYESKYDGEIYWYNDFYIARHQTVCLIDIADMIANENDFKSEDEKVSEEYIQEKVNAFIANCMKLGVHSFVNDW